MGEIMLNDDPSFLQKKPQKNNQLFLLISKDLRVIEASPGITKLFNETSGENFRHSIIDKLFIVNNIKELNLKNNILSELIVNETVYDVFVSELSSYYIVSFSIKNNLFNLLKVYFSSRHSG